jgi:hypothetical protein
MGQGIEGNAMVSVRPIMEAVADLAERTNVAMLVVHHPPKQAGKAMHAFSGSIAFIAAPRLGFVAVAEEETGRKLLLPVKNTLAPLASGRGYFIVNEILRGDIKTSRVEWDSRPVTVNANDALRASSSSPRRSKAEQAKELLNDVLGDGPMDASKIIEIARKQGISERTLREAKRTLGVKDIKAGFQGSSRWELP